MRYLEEFRDRQAICAQFDAIANVVNRSPQTFTVMEVCGGQTHNLAKYGILEQLPPNIELIHGPGCPVCVTPSHQIDYAAQLSLRPKITLCTYGDMMRVPGSEISLAQARAEGGSIRVVTSPIEAVEYAHQNSDREIVFFAVGFETTAPATALAISQAKQMGLANFSVLGAHVRVPPAMELILGDPENRVRGFLAAGHVCTIMGLNEYETLSRKFETPIVVTGFEPLDLLLGIHRLLTLMKAGEHGVVNEYARVVKPAGNPAAKNMLLEVFEQTDQPWRGLGQVPLGGLQIVSKYDHFDASKKFALNTGCLNEKNTENTKNTEGTKHTESTGCQSGLVLTGKIKPHQCPHFNNGCTPSNPMGAPMVSTEGACAAYFLYKTNNLYKTNKLLHEVSR